MTTCNATIETTKAISAYYNGLVSEDYPHFTLLQNLCGLIDKLNNLYDYEEQLTYQKCHYNNPEGEERLSQLSKEIERTQQDVDIAELNLANAITSTK